jgi:hypothetical protein
MRAFAAEVRPLPWLEPAVAAGFGLALVALLTADIPGTVRGVLIVTFAVAAFGTRRELRRAAAVRSVQWDGERCWTWNGTAVTVSPSSRVHPGLVVLVVSAPARAVHWIPRAAMRPDAFRRLKTALRHGGVDVHPAGASPPATRRPSDTPC